MAVETQFYRIVICVIALMQGFQYLVHSQDVIYEWWYWDEYAGGWQRKYFCTGSVVCACLSTWQPLPSHSQLTGVGCGDW